MRILIDGDGCPVIDETIKISSSYNFECLILCDTSHVFERAGAKTLTFSKGADSVDFALVNLLEKNDIVVTQDYGLAAMCLARNALPINQDGMEYTSDNIDSLLLARHTAKKIRNSGKRLKGPKKRTKEQNKVFEDRLKNLIKKNSQDS
jgi:hypothetical protein